MNQSQKKGLRQQPHDTMHPQQTQQAQQVEADATKWRIGIKAVAVALALVGRLHPRTALRILRMWQR